MVASEIDLPNMFNEEEHKNGFPSLEEGELATVMNAVATRLRDRRLLENESATQVVAIWAKMDPDEREGLMDLWIQEQVASEEDIGTLSDLLQGAADGSIAGIRAANEYLRMTGRYLGLGRDVGSDEENVVEEVEEAPSDGFSEKELAALDPRPATAKEGGSPVEGPSPSGR